MLPGGARSGLGPEGWVVAADLPGAGATFTTERRTRPAHRLGLIEDLDGFPSRFFRPVFRGETDPQIGPDEGQFEQVGSDTLRGARVDFAILRAEQEVPLLPDG